MIKELLKSHFPWLGTEDQANGADVIDTLNQWYAQSGTACPSCNGKGFLNPDGGPVNAFEGLDRDIFVVCKGCGGTGKC
jgi:hypothetical protein